MTKFNPENKKILTYGEALTPAMAITDKSDAAQYLEKYIAYIQSGLNGERDKEGRTAGDIAKINLGYFAGYYDPETMSRVNALFNTAHPFFG